MPTESPRRPLVVALIDCMEVSGPGRQLAALGGALRERGLELRVVTFRRHGRPTAPYVEHLRAAGITHEVLSESGPLDWRLVARTREVLDRWQADIVQTHGYKPSAIAYALRIRGAPWRWVGFFHGDTAENAKVKAYNWLHRCLLPSADRVVVMNSTQRGMMRHRGAHAVVIHNAVLPSTSRGEESRFMLNDLATRLPRPLIGVVSRLSPEKGVDTFLEACASLRTAGFDFGAVICGDGPERARLEHRCAELDLQGTIRFLGHLPSADALYPMLDLVVIPSRNEGLPNVLLEALRSDVPVVATRVGGIPEVLDGVTAGLMVPPDTPGELAEAMATALSPDYRTATSEGRAAVGDRFSLASRTERHLRLYTELLNQSPRASKQRIHSRV